MLFPVYVCNKLDPAAVCIKQDLLGDCRVGRFSCDLKRCAYRTKLCPLHPLYIVHIPEFFGIENIDIPVVKINRLVFIHPQQVGAPALLYRFPVVFFIIDARKHALFVQLDVIKRCFQLIVAVQYKCRLFVPVCKFCQMEGLKAL